MTFKNIIDDNLNPIKILVKWFQRKHSVLILISERNESKESTTVFDIMEAFKISQKNAYKILGDLQSDKSVQKGTKINQYYSYILSKHAKRELEIISMILNGDIDLRLQ